jgi:hypothetical protein
MLEGIRIQALFVRKSYEGIETVHGVNTNILGLRRAKAERLFVVHALPD